MPAAPLPATVNLEVYRGDSWEQSFAFARGGVPLDLNPPMIVASEARDSKEERTSLSITVVDPNEGMISIEGHANLLHPGIWVYDIEISNGDTGETTTWVRGRIVVSRDVTNEPL